MHLLSTEYHRLYEPAINAVWLAMIAGMQVPLHTLWVHPFCPLPPLTWKPPLTASVAQGEEDAKSECCPETPEVAHARVLRMEKLRQLGLGEDYELTFSEAQEVFLRWQTQWAASEDGGAGMYQRPRSKFESYLHQNVGIYGKKVVQLVLYTGCPEKEAREMAPLWKPEMGRRARA